MKVAILPEPTTEGEVEYRAIAGGRQALAKTAGAALDAITAQLPAEDTGFTSRTSMRRARDCSGNYAAPLLHQPIAMSIVRT